ncbi:MAG TPA: HAD hydrolase-like protein [Lachnospiraceae bacterium]|nr:HAD hydrolase-like protein [Lachnospiraceae bacterium]
MNDYVLFDLDGTLTDPKVGITTCVQYALASFGIEEPNLDKLTPFIGPSLKESFMDFYDFDEEKAEAAIEKYRERFTDTGIFENEIYPGILEMIRKLKGNHKKLAVASSKPTVFVERILEHFEIKRYFDVIVGSELDGTRVDKAEVVREALNRLYGDSETDVDQKRKATVMVGDRKFDVAGAKAEGIKSVAVTYGYGPMDELRIAKPDYIVRSVEELEKILLSGGEKPVVKKAPPMNKLWYIIFPALMFYFVRELGSYAGMFAVSWLANALPKNLAEKLVYWDEAGEKLMGATGTGTAVMLLIAFLITGYITWKFFAKADIGKAEEELKSSHAHLKSPLDYICMVIGTLGAALGLNYLFELVGITAASEVYQDIASVQYATPIYLGLILYGILVPLVEELVFRGVVYNRAKKSMKYTTAILLSAACFGIYHQNAVQGFYGFLMGCLIAYLYERFGHFYVAVIVHAISNMVVYLMTYVAAGFNLKPNWLVCILLLVMTAVCIFFISRPTVKLSLEEQHKTTSK